MNHPADDPVDPALDSDSTLEVEVVPTGTTVELHLRGVLDLCTVGTFRACVDQLDPDCRRVVVDMAEVSFVDSTGVGALVHARRELDNRLGSLWIVNPSERARFVFDLTGLGLFILEPSAETSPVDDDPTPEAPAPT